MFGGGMAERIGEGDESEDLPAITVHDARLGGWP